MVQIIYFSAGGVRPLPGEYLEKISMKGAGTMPGGPIISLPTRFGHKRGKRAGGGAGSCGPEQSIHFSRSAAEFCGIARHAIGTAKAGGIFPLRFNEFPAYANGIELIPPDVAIDDFILPGHRIEKPHAVALHQRDGKRPALFPNLQGYLVGRVGDDFAPFGQIRGKFIEVFFIQCLIAGQQIGDFITKQELKAGAIMSLGCVEEGVGGGGQRIEGPLDRLGVEMGLCATHDYHHGGYRNAESFEVHKRKHG